MIKYIIYLVAILLQLFMYSYGGSQITYEVSINFLTRNLYNLKIKQINEIEWCCCRCCVHR